MDLWIRSQDKETITKIEGVSIGDSSNWYENSLSETMDNIIGDGGGYFINALPSDRPLGYYETKERALEILNNITKIISSTDDNGRTTYVYEMPKE